MVFDHGSTLLLLPVRSFLYQWLNLGQYGVFVFFLVSGYIVPASLERKGSVRGFWISRAFRLYPMFLVGLLLSALAYSTGHGTIGNAGAHPVTAVLGWLFMLQNLNAGLNVPVVTWTLSYEMVFYLLLAGLFSWGVHRRSGWYATAFAVGAVALGGVLPMAGIAHWSRAAGPGPLVLDAVTDALILAGLACALSSRPALVKGGTSLAALVALVLLTFNQSYPYPWAGCVILALMFAGTLIYRVERGQYRSRGGDLAGRRPRWPAWWYGARERHMPLLCGAVVVLVLLLATVAGIWHGARYGHHWQVQWATSVLLAGATFGAGLAVRHRRVPGWCAWLGMISYSVYLLHSLVFNAYRSVRALHFTHTVPGELLLFAGLVAVIVALSALTYYLIEKPMQRLGHRVAARFPYPTGTPSAEGSSALGEGSPALGEGSPNPGDGSSALGDGAAASRSASSSTAVAGGSGGSP